MNRSAKGGARSSLRFGDEGVLIHPPHQGDCGRHGTEGQRVTSGELIESLGWYPGKRTYKRKRNGERCSVSSRTAAKYLKRGESHVTGQPATEVGRGRRPAKAGGTRREARRVKPMRWISSLSEKPVHHRLRILVTRISLTDAPGVHLVSPWFASLCGVSS